MRYEGAIFRPFSEANSYLLQCTIGCSHNKCTFCGMYKDKKYRVRALDEIIDDIHAAGRYYPHTEKVFLIDGDAIEMETDTLMTILHELKVVFPLLRHVGTYVGPLSTLKKSLPELKALREQGLTKAYLGVETGNDKLLEEIHKGVNRAAMLKAGQNLVEAGINLSAMVLLGISGEDRANVDHAVDTAEICNAMRPNYLAALTVTPVPGTILYNRVRNGTFHVLEPLETLKEMKMMFENITIDNLKFVGVHASNYLPVNGTLQRDKKKMIETVDKVLREGDKAMLRDESMRGL